MIHRVNNQTLPKLLSLAGRDPFGYKISGIAAAYKTDFLFAEYWIQTNQGKYMSIIGRFENQITVSVFDYDLIEEITAFVGMLYGIDSVFCSKKTAEYFGTNSIKQGCVMKISKQNIHLEDDSLNVIQPSIKQAYELLEKCQGEGIDLPPFEAFYVDTAYRLKYDCQSIVGIEQDGKLSALAMTTSETATAAVIGGVAVESEFRGRGLGKMIVKILLNRLHKKEIALFCAENIKGFYEDIGFYESDKWTFN